jgi:hypothetical protein
LAIIIYSDVQRNGDAQTLSSEAYSVLHPFWRREPQLHGNDMVRILFLRVRLASSVQIAAACDFARQSLAAAYDPEIKRQATDLIAKFCP